MEETENFNINAYTNEYQETEPHANINPFYLNPRRSSKDTAEAALTQTQLGISSLPPPSRDAVTSTSFVILVTTHVPILLTTSVMFKIFLVIASLSLCGVGVNQSFWNVSFTNF